MIGDDPQWRYVFTFGYGLGDRWFTAVNTPQAIFCLFFAGSGQLRTWATAPSETYLVLAALAMIAAPHATLRGMEAGEICSEEMAEIYLERNMQLQIPCWDFQGLSGTGYPPRGRDRNYAAD